MSNMQKTLDALQPYVIGIRYLDGTPLIDVIFKEGWSVPDEPNIERVKGDEGMNYHMIFSEAKGFGLDELLSYVERVIKLNQEREKKHELLREKVNELKEIFKRNSLVKLSRLKFLFSDEELVPTLDDFDVDLESSLTNKPVISNHVEDPLEEDIVDEPIKNVGYLDENGKQIVLTDEDKEMMEEEARAERNRRVLANKKPTSVNNVVRKVELPPKKKIEMVLTESSYESDCECENDEACSKCIDSKNL